MRSIMTLSNDRDWMAYAAELEERLAQLEERLVQIQAEDQRKLSESLVTYQEQLETIFEAQQDIVLLYDPGMNVQRVNHAFQETYGFDPIGMNIKEIVERVDCRTLDGQPIIWDQQPTPLALKGEKVAGMRFLVQRLDGSDQVVQTSASPIWRRNVVIGSVTVWHDITGIKQSEQALQAQQDILRGILDATRESIWLFDPDGTILAANQTVLSRLNILAEEVIGKNFKLFVPAELTQTRQEHLREVVETKLPLEFEDQRAGIIFHHTFYPVIDTKGMVTSIASFSRDISESKRVEAALRTSEERLAGFLESTHDSFFALDFEWRFLYVNRQFCVYLQREPEDLIGKNFWEAFPNYLGTSVEQHYRRAMEERTPVQVGASGIYTQHWFEISIYPTQTGISVFGANRTEQHQAEQDLAEANVNLERKVHQRTVELERSLENEKMMRQQLIQSEKYAALARLVALVWVWPSLMRLSKPTRAKFLSRARQEQVERSRCGYLLKADRRRQTADCRSNVKPYT